MADLQTLLSYFLNDLYAGTLGVTLPIAAVRVGDGSAAAPSLTFASAPTYGFWHPSGALAIVVGGTNIAQIGGTFSLNSTELFGWASGDPTAASADLLLSRSAAGVMKLAHGTATSPAELQVSGGNGGLMSAVKALTELTTIAAAATTSTAIQIPANAVVLGVSVRVVTIIPTAATFTVTSATPTKTWNTAAVTVAAGSTDPGTLPGPTYQTTASAITITPNLTPGAATGQVRVTIYYYTITPATS